MTKSLTLSHTTIEIVNEPLPYLGRYIVTFVYYSQAKVGISRGAEKQTVFPTSKTLYAPPHMCTLYYYLPPPYRHTAWIIIPRLLMRTNFYFLVGYFFLLGFFMKIKIIPFLLNFHSYQIVHIFAQSVGWRKGTNVRIGDFEAFLVTMRLRKDVRGQLSSII